LKQKFLNEIENEKAIAKLGGKTNAGQPIIYGTPKQRLEQLKGYSGENIDKIRELTEKEIEEEIDKEAMNDPTI
jgi:chromosome segregation and condensation protein ScpB